MHIAQPIESVSLDLLTDHTPALAVWDEYPSDSDPTPAHGIARPLAAHVAYKVVNVRIGSTTVARTARVIRSGSPK